MGEIGEWRLEIDDCGLTIDEGPLSTDSCQRILERIARIKPLEGLTMVK